MPITFNCPQGHRLTCPDELAGKPGKCPKCGVVLRVPQASTVVAAAAVPRQSTADDEPASQLESAGDSMTTEDLAADQIIFLCPNGHRLHGSAGLAGRPGQCPHCGVKFLVPSPDEEDEDEPFAEEEATEMPFSDVVIQIDTSGKTGSSKSGKAAVGSNSSLPASTPPLATLLSKLWRYKAQGASVEIHLGDGRVLEPDQISLKDANHALFASREASGTHTLTAVAWSSIERIVVRGLEQPPKEWF
ncbi:MAG TPA: hypothetical protein VG125_05665 [Pirellulales bacterium]|jgi:hypothetical protein|nr:hypothetical protein [Pirellulales bacterium]